MFRVVSMTLIVKVVVMQGFSKMYHVIIKHLCIFVTELLTLIDDIMAPYISLLFKLIKICPYTVSTTLHTINVQESLSPI